LAGRTGPWLCCLPCWWSDETVFGNDDKAAKLPGSELEKRAKPLAAMRHSERALAGRIARGADIIIAGHVHEPGERTIEVDGRAGRVLTLGAWGDSPGARAEWNGADLRLVL